MTTPLIIPRLGRACNILNNTYCSMLDWNYSTAFRMYGINHRVVVLYCDKINWIELWQAPHPIKDYNLRILHTKVEQSLFGNKRFVNQYLGQLKYVEKQWVLLPNEIQSDDTILKFDSLESICCFFLV